MNLESNMKGKIIEFYFWLFPFHKRISEAAVAGFGLFVIGLPTTIKSAPEETACPGVTTLD